MLLKRKELTEMIELEKVLHKPTPPPNDERWHIRLKHDQPEELLAALEEVMKQEPVAFLVAEWITHNEMVICLHWIDNVISNQVAREIKDVSFYTDIIFNEREQCHGHNMPSPT